ncbi:MAG: peptide chain release factor N(5)-glutamine methyltransferase [Patescibacteria group bacterium]
MTINELLLFAKKQLEHVSPDSPWLDAEVLLSYVLQKPRPWLLAHQDQQLNKVTIQQFNHLTMRRTRGEPVAYLTGEKEFCGLSFKVNPSVLIPRPATEELVETIVQRIPPLCLPLTKGENMGVSSNNLFTILDIGTGSGCIAITLAKRFPAVKVIATDISRDALAVAQENATRHGVSDRITFLHGNLLEPIITFLLTHKLTDSKLITIANLPYVPSPVIAAKSELAHEPMCALDGGPDGTEIYQQLITQLLNCLPDKLLPEPAALYFEGDNAIIPLLLNLPETKQLSQWYTVERQNHVLSLHKNLERR